MRQHHQQINGGTVGVRVGVCPLPSKRPWLNPMAPTWSHAQRAVLETDRRSSADELEARRYAYDGCQRQEHLIMPTKVA